MANNIVFLVDEYLQQPNPAVTGFANLLAFNLNDNRIKGNSSYISVATGAVSNIVQLTGTVKGLTSSNTIVGQSSIFDLELSPGDRIRVTGFTNNTVVRVHSITGAQTMIVTPRPPVSFSTAANAYIRKLETKAPERFKIGANGHTIALKSLTVAKNLKSVGNTSVGGNLSVVGNANILGSINLGGTSTDSLSITGTFSVSGNSIFRKGITLYSNTRVRATLTPLYVSSTITNLSLDSSNTYQLTGTVKTNSSSNTIIGQGTNFSGELVAGDRVGITAQGTVVRVHSISGAQTMIVTPRPSASITTGANAYIRFTPTTNQTVNLKLSGSLITDTILSSDSNLGYKLNTSSKRQIFSAYGFDFKLDNGILTPINKTRYTNFYTGASVNLTVPAGVTRIFVKMWGAGGGGGSYGGWRQGSSGGAGGFSHGIISVVPAEIIILRVGGRGQARHGASAGWPDGGAASVSAGDNQYSASGGGSSSIYVPSQTAYVMYAGGGGGGGSVNGWSRNSGGAGGGTIGEVAPFNSYNLDGTHSGKGGTQSAGGAGGTGALGNGSAGSLGQGGTYPGGSCYSAGGGGGYYGGGSGGYGTSSMGGGGGGSGRIHSSVIMGQTYTGSHHIPPFFNDPDLDLDTAARYGKGADESNYGGHGLIVLYY